MLEKINNSKTQVKMSQWLSGDRPEKATVIILSGGKSSRMGKDKATIKIEGFRMIDRLINKLKPFFDEIIISNSSTNSISNLPNVKMVYDKENGHGPLMGLYSSLLESNSRVNFVIACDIPKVNINLMNRLLSGSVNNEISVPSFTKDKYEPLFAMYTKDCITKIEDLLNKKQYKLSNLIKNCKSEVITNYTSEWYHNLNTPDDLNSYLHKTKG